jgi:hypothetical protein
MSTVLIHESRRLVFPLDTVVDAVIALEKEHGRWPAQAKITSVKLSRSSGLTVVLAAAPKMPPDERRYSQATIAAAVIRYCLRMRVPMPRNATKSVQIAAEGFELALETKLFLQRQHAEPPADASVNTVQVAALRAAAAPLESEPSIESETPPAIAGAPADEVLSDAAVDAKLSETDESRESAAKRTLVESDAESAEPPAPDDTAAA